MPDPVNVTPPTISGTPQVGNTLSVSSVGTWTNSPIHYTYQWKRDVASNEVFSNVAGRTSSSYLVTSADLGCKLLCIVTADNTASPSPSFTPTRTVTVTNGTQLTNAINDLRIGDLVDCSGTFTGQVEIRNNLAGIAVFDFTGSTLSGSGGSAVGLFIVGANNIRILSGVYTNPGGDGIRVENSDNIALYDPVVHNVGSQGILIQGNGGSNTNISLIRPETYACGDISKDSHTTAPGTGLHGIYFGGGLYPSSGEITDAHVHDQAYGCGIEIGANAQNLTVTNPLIEDITGASYGDAAGNAFNIWGGGNRNVVIDGATGSGISGSVVQLDDTMASGSAAWNLDISNCDFTGPVGRSPAYMTSAAITYTSCVVS